MQADSSTGSGSDTGHTPGPWGVCQTGIMAGKRIEAPTGAVADVRKPLSSWPLESNVRLIAAAPELLAACEALVDVAQSGDHAKALDRAAFLAADAISKATGQDGGGA